MNRRILLASASAALLAAQHSSFGQEPKYRVGILGTDNSHAGAFAKLINVDKKIPNVEVVAMYGDEAGRTKEMAAAGNVKTIVDRPEQMMDLVNVAIVDFRHGGLHKDMAMPFIEKGIPTFVDKPFALKTDDAYVMLYAAQNAKTYLSSFSTVRWGDEVAAFKAKLPELEPKPIITGPFHGNNAANKAKLPELEPIITGSASGPGSADSEYGGFGFYGIHTIELITHTIADRVTHVSALRQDSRVTGTLITESGKIFSINIADGISGFRLQIVGAKENYQLSTGGSYENGLKVFFEGLEKGELPLKFDELFEPVAIIEAMEASMQQNGIRTEVKCFC